MLGHPAFLRKLRGSRYHREDGSAPLEMALSATILISLVFAIMTVCQAAYSYFYISNAAREATRYAIVRGNDQTGDCTSPGYANCIAQTGDIQTYVRNLGFPGIVPSNLAVATTWLKSNGTACGTTDTCKASGNLVQSTTTYTYTLTIPFFPAKTLSMTSKSQMVVSY